jgi:HlyD family secretion protein
MTQAEQTKTKKKSRKGLVWGLIVVLVLVLAGALVLASRGLNGFPALGRPQAQSATKTAPVTSITAVTSVTSAGPVSAVQAGAVVWKTTGTVTTVNVKPGDHVKTGDALMSIAPLSVPQNLIQAQADLIAAQKALDDLLHPSALTIANARKSVANAQDTLDALLSPAPLAIANAQQTVAKAQDTLDKARKTLGNTKSPDVKYYQDQVKSAQDALTNAQQNTTLTDIGQLPVSLRNAQTQLERATNVYNNARDEFAKCPACEKVWAYDRMTNWVDAVNLYNDAVNQVQQIQLQIDQSQRGNSLSLTAAQDKLDTAQRNLKWALNGPDTVTLSVNQAAVGVAESALADAQDKLSKLVNGNLKTDIGVAEAALADAKDKLNHLLTSPDPNDLAIAQVRVLALQASVQAITLTAPFEGEVLAVNNQIGDTASVGEVGVALANRSLLRVDAQVDEADIGQIRVGNPVSLTLEALPEVALAGKVVWINGGGTTVQGLVKYTVRIDIAGNDPRVLLGMTANVAIVTNTQVGALAVPLDAVQLDQEGEYVNRVKDGVVERVKVTSGQIDGDQVVVTGNLLVGDEVQVIPPKSASSNPFGGP